MLHGLGQSKNSRASLAAGVICPVGCLNSQDPNGDNGPEYGQSADRPACDVQPAIVLGLIDHRVMPMVHESLL